MLRMRVLIAIWISVYVAKFMVGCIGIYLGQTEHLGKQDSM